MLMFDIRPPQVVFLFLVQAKYKIGCGREGLAIMPLFLKQAVKMGDTIFQHLKPIQTTKSLRFCAT